MPKFLIGIFLMLLERLKIVGFIAWHMGCYRFEGDLISGQIHLTIDRIQFVQTAAKNRNYLK